MKKLEIAKRYEVLLKCEQLLISGSTALHYYGLTDKEGGDLDLVLVNPTEEALSVLKSIQEGFPARTKPYPDGSVSFIFMHDGVKVDIFIRDKKLPNPFDKVDIFISNEKLPNPFEINGVKLDSIKNIIKAKRNMNRLKDWAQLRNIGRLFFKEEEYQKFLNSF